MQSRGVTKRTHMREMFLVDTGGPHTGVSGAGGDGLTTRSDVVVPRAMGFLPQACAAPPDRRRR
jgi:hypothetical protein